MKKIILLALILVLLLLPFGYSFTKKSAVRQAVADQLAEITGTKPAPDDFEVDGFWSHSIRFKQNYDRVFDWGRVSFSNASITFAEEASFADIFSSEVFADTGLFGKIFSQPRPISFRIEDLKLQQKTRTVSAGLFSVTEPSAMASVKADTADVRFEKSLAAFLKSGSAEAITVKDLSLEDSIEDLAITTKEVLISKLDQGVVNNLFLDSLELQTEDELLNIASHQHTKFAFIDWYTAIANAEDWDRPGVRFLETTWPAIINNLLSQPFSVTGFRFENKTRRANPVLTIEKAFVTKEEWETGAPKEIRLLIDGFSLKESRKPTDPFGEMLVQSSRFDAKLSHNYILGKASLSTELEVPTFLSLSNRLSLGDIDLDAITAAIVTGNAKGLETLLSQATFEELFARASDQKRLFKKEFDSSSKTRWVKGDIRRIDRQIEDGRYDRKVSQLLRSFEKNIQYGFSYRGSIKALRDDMLIINTPELLDEALRGTITKAFLIMVDGTEVEF